MGIVDHILDGTDSGFFTEADVLKFTPKWRWLSVKVGPFKVFAMNWVVSLIASAVLWTFVGVSLGDSTKAGFTDAFNTGKTWFTQNFTWLYVGSQDAWLLFLLWLVFTKYGSIKLGKDGEKPAYGDLSWFSMLFCTGIGVGFFVFGVSEPVYYYRQPQVWKSWNYDYNLNKPGHFDDDQRANQAIFVSFFHWGLHGWIPYITPTILLGLCSHRYGLPMGIRTCFFPLLGNQVFGLFGDIIDALSIACTTFGVCTSLGLGVYQLMDFWARMRLYFNDVVVTFDNSDFTELIVAITLFANLSVILGLDQGLLYVSYFAMAIAFAILLPVFFADNSMYIANVIVQGAGYYIQHFIQVGFDCEAFQQLAFEFGKDGDSLFWGAGYGDLQGKLAAVNISAFGELAPAANMPLTRTGVGLEIASKSVDCGAEPNPCNEGMILASIAALSAKYLMSVGLSATDAQLANTMATSGDPRYATYLPCGSSNATHTIPDCPTTKYDDVASWGTCEAHFYNCYTSQAYFGSTNPQFMDWWTVFYWAWWISWAPFFGIFVGTVSKGRTIRMTVIGGFIAPLVLIMLWFGTFGALAIKMERTAELALGVKPDWKHGTIDCAAAGYSGATPTSTEAKALADLGYYLLACRMPKEKQFFDVLMPYKDLLPFLMPASFIALLVWFITSSDSGSYVDDLLASSGLSNPPIIQKIYWCWTEGATAIALVNGGQKAALKAVRSASICAGFFENLFLCYFCTAIYRLVKFDMKDEDIIGSQKFNTQLLDILNLFEPIKTVYSKHPGLPYTPMQQVQEIVIALFAPGVSAYEASKVMYGPTASIAVAVLAQLLWIAFIVCQGLEVDVKGMFAMGWTLWMFYAAVVLMMRAHMRAKYNIWGSLPEDFWVAMTIPPFALAQMKMQAANDGQGMRGLFEDLTELVEYDAANPKQIEDGVSGTRTGDIEVADKTTASA